MAPLLENDNIPALLQSPEKFQRSLIELTAAVEGERSAVEEADRACSELAARQEMVGKVGSRVLAGPPAHCLCAASAEYCQQGNE